MNKMFRINFMTIHRAMMTLPRIAKNDPRFQNKRFDAKKISDHRKFLTTVAIKFQRNVNI